jgi:hypothetical protein
LQNLVFMSFFMEFGLVYLFSQTPF